MRYTNLCMALFLAVSWLGCNVNTIEETRFQMNTYVRIKIWGTSQENLNQALDAAFREVERVEALTSHFNEKSEVKVLNTQNRIVSSELSLVVCDGLEVSRLSGGAFDPTVYPLLELWGFYDTTGDQTVPASEEIDSVLEYVAWQKVRVKGDTVTTEGVKVDLSGIAKGYAVDKAVEVLQNMGIKKALIDAGGDIFCLGTRSPGWRIGIRHPRKQGLIGIVKIPRGAIATSGDYENFYIEDGIRYHHLIDPSTGEPARKAVSATVIAQTALQADAWATALFVMGKAGIDTLNTLAELEGLVILADGSMVMTDGFPRIRQNK
ncbi:FAD:protein FMN transferase [candidate division WOR-3 bacterium]|nr:FAD:protein FMN transferase [candidate division WOR-3 bacterium]